MHMERAIPNYPLYLLFLGRRALHTGEHHSHSLWGVTGPWIIELEMAFPSFLYKIFMYLNLFCFVFFLTVSFGWCIKGKWIPRQLSGKESICQYRRLGFDPWVGKIPWIRKWPLTPVFLLEESQEQGSLEDNSPWGHKETDTITKHVSSQKKPRDLPTQFGSSLESLLSHRLSTF